MPDLHMYRLQWFPELLQNKHTGNFFTDLTG